jgi:hypothetical protein
LLHETRNFQFRNLYQTVAEHLHIQSPNLKLSYQGKYLKSNSLLNELNLIENKTIFIFICNVSSFLPIQNHNSCKGFHQLASNAQFISQFYQMYFENEVNPTYFGEADCF